MLYQPGHKSNPLLLPLLFVLTYLTCLPEVLCHGTAHQSHVPRGISQRDTIPSSPPWVLPASISEPPPCLTTLTNCPWNGDLPSNCTALQCTEAFLGDCFQHTDMIDLSCVCPQLTSNDCSCGDALDEYISLNWLNLTCGALSNWTGLPAGWAEDKPKVDLINIANGNHSCYQAENSSGVFPSSWGNESWPLAIPPPYFWWWWFPTGYRLPDFSSLNCSAAALTLLQDSALNDTEINTSDFEGGLSQRSDTVGTSEADGLFLDRISFCSLSYEDVPTACKTEPIDRTRFLLWMQNLCQNVTTRWGWPTDWEDTLVLFNTSSYVVNNTNQPPQCLSSQVCYGTFLSNKTSCTLATCNESSLGAGLGAIASFSIGDATTWCDAVTGVPSTHNCTTATMVYTKPCYCDGLIYGSTCNNSCQLSWERAEYLQWINATCSATRNSNNLPANWTSLLSVQENELLPWQWEVRSENTTASSSTEKCSSTAAKLGAFLAVNAAMAVITPILGRRDVMKGLTFGFCGRRGSKWWMLTGPLTAMFHISSNIVAALLIKHTPGFSNVNVLALILLWCTRPRLAWFVVVLLPWGAKDHIYFSVASSTLLAEIIMQLIGSYYMGTATQYARGQKFYHVGRLNNVVHGKDAITMYAGSLLWLTVVTFAVVACSMSVFNVNQYVSSLVGMLLGREKKDARKFSLRCQEEIKRLSRQRERARKLQETHPRILQLVAIPYELEYPTLLKNWLAMVQTWQVLVYYLEVDIPAFRRLEKDYEKKKKRQERAKTRRQWRKYVNPNLMSDLETATWKFESAKARITDIPSDALRVIEDGVWIASVSAKAKERLDESLIKVDVYRSGNILSKSDKRLLVKIAHDLRDLLGSWHTINKTILESFEAAWRKQQEAREAEEVERNRDPSERLKSIANTTVFGMFGCWVAQWVWWYGYIQVSAGSYCPPKLFQIATIWTVFSVFGAIFGASL